MFLFCTVGELFLVVGQMVNNFIGLWQFFPPAFVAFAVLLAGHWRDNCQGKNFYLWNKFVWSGYDSGEYYEGTSHVGCGALLDELNMFFVNRYL
jgi:hypothetical protein